jgi:hypothetical protein
MVGLIERLPMPWHKPRFRLVHLIVLVAVVAVELVAMRFPVSCIFAVLSLITALLAASLGPLTKIEWFGIASVFYCVYSLLGPWVDSLYRNQ